MLAARLVQFARYEKRTIDGMSTLEQFYQYFDAKVRHPRHRVGCHYAILAAPVHVQLFTAVS